MDATLEQNSFSPLTETIERKETFFSSTVGKFRELQQQKKKETVQNR